MESNTLAKLLSRIGDLADVVRLRRGKYSAALWVVSEYLSDGGDGLVEYADTSALSNGAYLTVACVGSTSRSSHLADELFRGARRPGEQWSLCVRSSEGELAPAHLADPETLIEILETLPRFLDAYEKNLQLAAGTGRTLDYAREVVDSVFELVEEEKTPRGGAASTRPAATTTPTA